MACCGRQTPGIGESAAAGQFRSSPASQAARTQAVPRTQVYFEYVGGTGMTVIGAVTGLRSGLNAGGGSLERTRLCSQIPC
jgi:hypothetical protein